MTYRIKGTVVAMPLLIMLLSGLLAACTVSSTAPGEETTAAPEPPDAESVDLAAVKTYAAENAASMKEHTAELASLADQYFAIVEANGFDYEAAWSAEETELASLVAEMRQAWKDASLYYELDEGIVAGVPELSDYDAWIDAGPPGSEDPEGAYQWTLTLPDGRTLENPGNIFHTLLEPALYGTNPEFVGAEVDLDDDGSAEFTEVLPEANILKGASDALDGATADMIAAIDAWEPTLSDAFTALIVMTPTMSEYFGQWKGSVFIAGAEASEESFVGLSRLFDITNILSGLNLTYDTVSPLVTAENPELDSQIQAGYEDLTTYVDKLYEQEQNGEIFSAEQADQLGSEAQAKAEALAALVAQAATEIDVAVAE